MLFILRMINFSLYKDFKISTSWCHVGKLHAAPTNFGKDKSAVVPNGVSIPKIYCNKSARIIGDCSKSWNLTNFPDLPDIGDDADNMFPYALKMSPIRGGDKLASGRRLRETRLYIHLTFCSFKGICGELKCCRSCSEHIQTNDHCENDTYYSHKLHLSIPTHLLKIGDFWLPFFSR